MARFDPNTYPDRLVFEAYARRIRAEELDVLFSAAVAWLDGRQRELTSRLRKLATTASAHSHRHSTR